MSLLVNRIDKHVLKERLKEENLLRKTISFYRYINITNPQELRDRLYKKWSNWNCFGRVYLAHEGINAQMSVPEAFWEEFMIDLDSQSYFKDVSVKQAVDGNGKSFYKLILKVKDKIVADGINGSTRRDFTAKAGEILQSSACIYQPIVGARTPREAKLDGSTLRLGEWTHDLPP